MTTGSTRRGKWASGEIINLPTDRPPLLHNKVYLFRGDDEKADDVLNPVQNLGFARHSKSSMPNKTIMTRCDDGTKLVTDINQAGSHP